MLANSTITNQDNLPLLQDYDVSPITGFVPYPQPLARLMQPYYEPWEEILDQLNPLLDSRQLRARVDQLPLLEVDRLETSREQQRAYMLLSIMAHSYVWGSGLDIAQSIPEPLAVPWQAISDKLNIPPVLTYAANDLWNWKLKDPQGPYTLENLETLSTMTGTSDETWFDIVSVTVEVEGGAALQPLLEAMQAVREDNMATVTAKLTIALTQLEKVGKQLARMFEKCDPAVFYWKIRKFFAGSENMESLGLLNGLEYKGVGPNRNERKYLMGATAGQSSLFPALDLIFGIDHHERSASRKNDAATITNNGSSDIKNEPNALLLKMKGFMPAPHRAFLDHLRRVANLRAYILSKKAAAANGTENQDEYQVNDLIRVYDACVHQIKLFRDTHIQIVTRYILTQAKRGPPEGWEDYRVLVPSETKINEQFAQANVPLSFSKAASTEEGEPTIRGTGGSDLMPFLKNNRDETNGAKLLIKQ
ncbi:hypothetical protein EDD11_006850 [Mortierella claussenii]|nr:hypothetical protein EDD11_006850 [Mortierella claussenii]